MQTGFESVYEKHFREVHRFVRRFVQDVSLADELTHDTFLTAYEAWEKFRGEAPELVWLFRIARSVCLDYIRSPASRGRSAVSLDAVRERARGAGSPLDALSPTGREPTPGVEEAARQNEMSECVRQFVLTLPESLRTPLMLHDVEGFTNQEIAHVMGCSLAAAKMRLHRARERLRSMMEERCDIFHDERNVLSCLPAEDDLSEDGSRLMPQSTIRAM